MARSSPPSPFMQKFWDDYYSEKVKVKEVPEEEGDSGKAKKQPEEPLSFKAPEHKPSMFLQGFKQYKTEIEKEIDKANKEADRLRAKGFTNEQIDEEVGGRLRNLSSQIAVRTKGQVPSIMVLIGLGNGQQDLAAVREGLFRIGRIDPILGHNRMGAVGIVNVKKTIFTVFGMKGQA